MTRQKHRPACCLAALAARVAAWAVLFCAGPANAAQAPAEGGAKVYRCGPGHYSQSPCPAGQPVAVDPAPGAAQQREAEDIAARERRLAEQLRAERQARERAAAAQRPVRIGPPEPAASAPKQHHGSKLAKAKRRQTAASGADLAQAEPASRRAFAAKPQHGQKPQKPRKPQQP